MKITPRLAEMLTAQIKSELSAHQNYMAISFWFRRQSLDGWGDLFREQAMEEAQHAMKIIQFLLDTDVEFDLPPIPGASTQFADASAAVAAAQASEAKVTEEFKAMARAALEENDSLVHQFLQWFLEEQVEEEAKMAKLQDLVQSGINLFQAEPLLAGLEG